jgi:formate/nitrite transporter FocA (FNT family)
VVNLFVIPAAMMLGAPIGFGDWWLWNQIPALVGNFLGALVLVALGMYVTHRRPAGFAVRSAEPAGREVA